MSFEDLMGDERRLEQHERRITRCRSCQAKIIWFKTITGKNIPIDADTVEPDDEDLDMSRHVSHFATCPDGDRWRKPQ